jgi:hypothetical protein
MDLHMLATMGKVLGKPLHEMPNQYAQSQIYADTHGRQEPAVDPGVTPQMRTTLNELSGLAQGQSFGRPYSEIDDVPKRPSRPLEHSDLDDDDSADLPSRPTGPIQESNPTVDEMKGPLQQLNFMDPRYRNGGWF